MIRLEDANLNMGFADGVYLSLADAASGSSPATNPVFSLVASDTTERTGTSVGDNANTLSSVSGLALTSADYVLVTFSFRKTTGAAVVAPFGIKFDATQFISSASELISFGGHNESGDGICWFFMSPAEVGYTRAFSGLFMSAESGAGHGNSGIMNTPHAVSIPTTVDAITITANAGNAAVTVASQNLRVWKMVQPAASNNTEGTQTGTVTATLTELTGLYVPTPRVLLALSKNGITVGAAANYGQALAVNGTQVVTLNTKAWAQFDQIGQSWLMAGKANYQSTNVSYGPDLDTATFIAITDNSQIPVGAVTDVAILGNGENALNTVRSKNLRGYDLTNYVSGQSLAEVSTVSTIDNTPLVTISGLNIAAGTPIIAISRVRGGDNSRIGITINGTTVFATQDATDIRAGADGIVLYFLNGGIANYNHGIISMTSGRGTSNDFMGPRQPNSAASSALPSAAITSIGLVAKTTAGEALYVSDFQVLALPLV